MRTTLLAGLVVVLLLLSACGGTGPPGEPVTKAEDVLGVWGRTKDYQLGSIGQVLRNIHIKLEADGTMAFGMSPDKWDYEWMSLEFTFEGTQFSVSETAYRGYGELSERDLSCTSGFGAPDAVYEIQQLANGNLKFVDAQDGCLWRRQLLADAEWEPVP